MTGAAGTYQIAFIASGNNVGSGEIIWDGTNELSIADSVWEEALTAHTTSGTYGARVVRSSGANNELQLNAQNHASANVHQFQTAVIAADAFNADVFTAFAVPELQEIHLIHGLKSGSVLTVTPTSRAAGSVSQTIGGDGTTGTTVTRI